MKVKVGSTAYDLQIIDQEKIDARYNDRSDDDNTHVLGFVDFCLGTIALSTTPCFQILKQTFCHEIVHAMLNEIGESELCDDEGFVDAMGKQLYGFINDNNIAKIFNQISDSYEKKQRANN